MNNKQAKMLIVFYRFDKLFCAVRSYEHEDGRLIDVGRILGCKGNW